MIQGKKIKNNYLREENGRKNISRRRVVNNILRKLQAGGVDTVIVGASVAGLYLANEIEDCIVLERRKKVGGKVRTSKEYDNNTNPNPILFDDGPWRFHQSHTILKQLLDDHEIEYTKNSSYKKKKKETFNSPCKKGLSTFGSNAFDKGIETARENNIKSGYDGMAYADCGGNVYHGQRHKEGTYYFVTKGMRKIVDKLYKPIASKVSTNCMVVDIRKNNDDFTVIYLDSNGNTIELPCKNVILCAPAEKLVFPSIDKYIRPIRSSVESVPLMHVYAKLEGGEKLPPTYIIDPNLAITQIISGDYSSNYFQISYTGGRTAMYLRDLHLNYPEEFTEQIVKEFEKHFPDNKVDTKSIEVRYWDQAVHFWRPILKISGKNISDLSDQSIEPHPLALKGLYLCGESFSTKQGWIEGSLETAEKVLQRMKSQSNVLATELDENSLLIDGRVINVAQFKDIHPGSKTAIEGFLNKDASLKYQQIGHPPYAYGYLFQLQKGFQ